MSDRGVNPAVFWAKLSPRGSPSMVHPLICHMIDVAAVTRAIWDTVLTEEERRVVASSLGCSRGAAAPWIAFLGGLHDLGKASPAFQSTDPKAGERLGAAGLICRSPVRNASHGVVSTVSLMSILPAFGLSDSMVDRLAAVVGGHHGVFPRSAEVVGALGNPGAVGDGPWAKAREALAQLLATLLDLPSEDPPVRLDNATAMFLAGLISVADWIGSVEELFPPIGRYPYLEPAVDAAHYFRRSGSMARDALDLLGWTGWSPSSQALDFSGLFPAIQSPYPVQQMVADLADGLDSPGLVVVEAPMGEGKTEAAIYLADRWGAKLGQRGCYFALPTQATSDQMYRRVWEFLRRRYPAELVNLQLLHGHASLSALFQGLLRSGERQRAVAAGLEPHGVAGEVGYDGASAGVVAAEWFTYRKRGLLAPFGVGTVDQVLLAALQTRHVFVRLFGLAHKTVILDEVHAYDAYMTALLERLLEWLGALGSSVVLLSATLPDDRRLRLLEAYARGAGYPFDRTATRASYPRVTWVFRASSGARQVGVSPRSSRKLKLEWVDGALPADGESFALGERLRRALEERGGCVAVICNTVARAQQVYLALKPYFPDTADDGLPVLDLLHARYLYEDRRKREERTLVRFGKPDGEVEMGDGTVLRVRRPDRAVLVSTQIIEQSLDLDFDLMVTDLAPVDLLLQRSGRLHRHIRKGRPGPECPTLWVCRPREEDGVPIFESGFAEVYDEHVLLRTWLELRDRSEIQVPEDVEDLIESVYGERALPAESPDQLARYWETTWIGLKRLLETYDAKGRSLRILPPQCPTDEILEDFNRQLEEDDPGLSPSLQALTRLSDPTVSVVCLMAGEQGGEDDTRPDRQTTIRLLGRSVSISHRGIVPLLLKEDVPVGWRKEPLLRHHRLLRLDGDRNKSLGCYRLRLDEEIGLVVASSKSGRDDGKFQSRGPAMDPMRVAGRPDRGVGDPGDSVESSGDT